MTGPVATPPPRPFPAHVLADWDAAEAGLYQVVTARPDLYQRAVVLAAGVAADLRHRCLRPEDLLSWAGPGRVAERLDAVAAVAHAAGVPVGEPGSEEVARAACAIRAREIVAEEAARSRLARMRSGGGGWTTVEEWGDPQGTPWAPYRRLDVDPTGVALLVTTEPDVDLSGVLHRIEPVRMELDTGRVGPAARQHGGQSDGAPAVTAADAAAREAVAAAWKAWLADRPLP
jgi:hypothetical protein